MRVSAVLESLPGSGQGPCCEDHGAAGDLARPAACAVSAPTSARRSRPSSAARRPSERTANGRTRTRTTSGISKPARLTVLSGPSGVGKGTVVAEVRRRHPDVWVSVSVTTRRPRPGERRRRPLPLRGRRRVRPPDRRRRAAGVGRVRGQPLRHAPRAARARLATGAPALLEIELQGARQVRARDPEAQLVFLAPPSWAELVSRLAGRGTEPPAVQERRLALAQAELDAGRGVRRGRRQRRRRPGRRRVGRLADCALARSRTGGVAPTRKSTAGGPRRPLPPAIE